MSSSLGSATAGSAILEKGVPQDQSRMARSTLSFPMTAFGTGKGDALSSERFLARFRRKRDAALERGHIDGLPVDIDEIVDRGLSGGGPSGLSQRRAGGHPPAVAGAEDENHGQHADPTIAHRTPPGVDQV